MKSSKPHPKSSSSRSNYYHHTLTEIIRGWYESDSGLNAVQKKCVTKINRLLKIKGFFSALYAAYMVHGATYNELGTIKEFKEIVHFIKNKLKGNERLTELFAGYFTAYLNLKHLLPEHFQKHYEDLCLTLWMLDEDKIVKYTEVKNDKDFVEYINHGYNRLMVLFDEFVEIMIEDQYADDAGRS
jgi:hypothetical protein